MALTFAERISGEEFESAVLESIAITSEPAKKEYKEGEKLSLEGIEVTAKYGDGSEKIVTDFTVSGFEPIAGEHTVIVSYMEKTASFKVRVARKV